MVCYTYFNIKSSWVLMFWTFNWSFDILATVLATFPNIGQIIWSLCLLPVLLNFFSLAMFSKKK
jgi:hypothetical protein